jgi:glycosyltransferase involved in cell wall biosynthesis
MARPDISVIVTAFQRRPYLEAAIRSLQSQTLPPESWELLVVAGFQDAGLEAFVERAGGKWLDGNFPVGRALAFAYESSKGRIISFLDDDDEFAPEKLATVLRQFTQHPKLGYYHNAFVRMDAVGGTTKLQGPRPPQPLYISADDFVRRYPYVLRHDGAHNLSAISLRREIVEESKEYLRAIEGATDRFAYLTAAGTGYDLLLDPSELTRYRVHSTSAVHETGTGSGGSARIIEQSRRIYRTVAQMESMLEGRSTGKRFATELPAIRSKIYALTAGQEATLTPQDLATTVVHGVRTVDADSMLSATLAVIAGLTGRSSSQLIGGLRRTGLFL